jgi:hypothetical protein
VWEVQWELFLVLNLLTLYDFNMLRTALQYPLLIGLACFFVLWGAARLGDRVGERRFAPKELEEFNLVLGATLTLLGLIVGFAFSMAVGRYDQRKNYEEEEANAIGTEYVRADLLPSADKDKLHAMLKQYLAHRIAFFQTRDQESLATVNSEAAALQSQMWSIVAGAGQAQPTPINALVISGMNDVLNRQGYTQAAWWNRIPVAAWAFMFTIGICCNFLLGYAAGEEKARRPLIVLPIVLAIAFLLLADLDSPRGGVIRVRPQNLIALQDSLR